MMKLTQLNSVIFSLQPQMKLLLLCVFKSSLTLLQAVQCLCLQTIQFTPQFPGPSLAHILPHLGRFQLLSSGGYSREISVCAPELVQMWKKHLTVRVRRKTGMWPNYGLTYLSGSDLIVSPVPETHTELNITENSAASASGSASQ